MSHLARWLASKGETPAQFARRTGLSAATVDRAIHTRDGRGNFDLKTAVRLCIATGGEVPVGAYSADAPLLDELAMARRPRRRSA
jgi:hypothetical protein